MGWDVGYCRDGCYSNHKNDVCKWCGVVPETVLHVFNYFIDLQIQLLREEYREAATKPAAALCTDCMAALDFHASAVRLLGAAGGGL